MKHSIFVILSLAVISGSVESRGIMGTDGRRSLHPFGSTRKAAPPVAVPVQELETQFWLDQAKAFVNNQADKQDNVNQAKNVIFFIGDGMSLPTVAATRIFLGGEEKEIFFEKFPGIGVVKTYSIDKQVPDSACTATAYLTGVKANYGTIGVDVNVKRGHCTAGLNTEFHTSSIAKWAQDAKKSTGLVTTTGVTHASPAGVYAHVADRDWEYDTNVRKDCPDQHEIQDIASQLMMNEVGGKLEVILGGGRAHFMDSTHTDEGNVTGKRSDGKNLIGTWQQGSGERKYARNREELLAVDASKTDYLLGLFASNHMPFHLETVDENTEDVYPTLAEMTEKAIDVLSKNENGFFLFVEGGKIDMAHHENFAKIAFDETDQFAKAIELARKKLPEKDTLIVVSSDHSHTMQYSGYATRGAPITTITGKATDEFSYNTMSYANGEGFNKYFKDGKRVDPSTFDNSPSHSTYPATSSRSSETHGGDDVGVFASGPFSHLFTGTYEQNVLPHLMAYAACIGDGLTACDNKI